MENLRKRVLQRWIKYLGEIREIKQRMFLPKIFPITNPKRFMLTFMVVDLIMVFRFSFLNKGSFTTNSKFQ